MGNLKAAVMNSESRQAAVTKSRSAAQTWEQHTFNQKEQRSRKGHYIIVLAQSFRGWWNVNVMLFIFDHHNLPNLPSWRVTSFTTPSTPTQTHGYLFKLRISHHALQNIDDWVSLHRCQGLPWDFAGVVVVTLRLRGWKMKRRRWVRTTLKTNEPVSVCRHDPVTKERQWLMLWPGLARLLPERRSGGIAAVVFGPAVDVIVFTLDRVLIPLGTGPWTVWFLFTVVATAFIL